EVRAEERLLDLLLPPTAPSPLPPPAPRPGDGSRETGDPRPLFVVSSKGDVTSKPVEADTEAQERRRRTREKLRQQLKEGKLEERDVEIEVQQQGFPMLEMMQPPQVMEGPDVNFTESLQELLPIVEGSTVQTRYGYVRTDHILFIAAGAFHVSKPSDLIPELQGRFPIRVELQPLTEEDFVRIMTEPENALTKQYAALCAAEG